MLKRFAYIAFFLLLTGGAIADSCSPTGQTCVRRGNVTVAGVLLQNVCLEMAKTELCQRSVPVNTCTTFEARQVSSTPLRDNQCRLISQTCTASNLGHCSRYEKVYECWNGPASVASVTRLSRNFHNFDDSISDNCAALVSDPNCSLQHTYDSIGYQNRNINELMVARSWWEKTHEYDCTDNSYVDTCGDYEDNPVCTKIDDSACLVYAPDGSCQYEQQIYECDADSSFEANCQAVNVCVGDNCTGVEQEPSDQYPNAAAWLNFLDDMADANRCQAQSGTDPTAPTQDSCIDHPDPTNGGEPRIFEGELMSCDFNVGKDCCSSPYEGRCTDEERTLKERRDAGAVVYMGLGCAYRFLGVCLTEQYEYCVYKTKFARVFQQQAHVQTNAQFAWLTDTPCPALTVEQLGQINIEDMNLSEVFGDMLESTDVPVEEYIMNEVSSDMGVFTTNVQNNFE